MFNKKKLPKMLLLLMLCLCVSGIAAAAAESSGSDYICSQIIYYSQSGEVSYLEPGAELWPTVTVRVPEGAEAQKMVLVTTVYKDNKLVDADVYSAEVGASDTGLSTRVIIPDSVENCFVNTVLWNNLREMKPICNASIFPSGTAELVGLKIDGVSIEGFDPDTLSYTATVSPYARKAPQIETKTLDASAKVEVIPPASFPGSSTVRVTATDGTTKDYIVNYKCSEDLVTDIRMSPDLPAATPLPEFKHNLQTGDTFAADRSYICTSVPPEYAGKDYIQGCFGWGNSALDYTTSYWESNNAIDWYSFTLKRSAMVKVVVVGGNMKLTEEAYGFARQNPAPKIVTNIASNGTYDAMYQRHFDASEGAPATITLPNLGKTTTTYMVILEYDGYEG